MNRLLQSNKKQHRTFPRANLSTNPLMHSLHALNQSSDLLGRNKRGLYYSGNTQLGSLFDNLQPSTSQKLPSGEAMIVRTSGQNFAGAFDDMQDFEHSPAKSRRISHHVIDEEQYQHRITLQNKIDTLGTGLDEYLEGILHNQNAEPDNGQVLMAVHLVGKELKEVKEVLFEMMSQLNPVLERYPEMTDVLNKCTKTGSKLAIDKGWNVNFENSFLINLNGRNAKISEQIKNRDDLKDIVRYHQDKYIWPEPKYKGIGLKSVIQEHLSLEFNNIDNPTKVAYAVAQFLWNRDHSESHFITVFIQNGEPNKGHQEKRHIVPREEKELFGKIMLYCGGYLIADHCTIGNGKQVKSNWFQWINQGREMVNLRGNQAKSSGKNVVPRMLPDFIPIFERPEFKNMANVPAPAIPAPNLVDNVEQVDSASHHSNEGNRVNITNDGGDEDDVSLLDELEENGPKQRAVFDDEQDTANGQDEANESHNASSSISQAKPALQERNSAGRNLRAKIRPPTKLQL